MAQQDEGSAAAESGIYTLPSVLDVRAAPALAESLRHHIASAETVALDGQMVERVSTPCLQILLATALDAQSRGIAFRFCEPSPVLTRAIAELGLASGFDR